MPIIPARKGVAFSVKAGQNVKVINTYGKQALDFWAFNPSDPNGFLSMAHTRAVTRKVALARGDKLYSTRRKPMMTLAEDSTRGIHDLIFPACDAERYRMQGVEGYHDNCSDNLHNALMENFPDFRIPDDWTPDPFNIFMNVPIDHHGGIDIKPPTSEKGQFVVLRAEADLIVAISACPQDLDVVNSGMPTDCEYQVSDAAGASI